MSEVAWAEDGIINAKIVPSESDPWKTVYAYNVGVSCATVRMKVAEYVGAIKPKMVFDLCMGVGAYGYAIRQGTPSIQMTGMDGCLKYLTSVYAKQFYRVLIHANLSDWLAGTFEVPADIVLFMDVIEHLDREQGARVLVKLIETYPRIIVSTPLFDYKQGAVDGNLLEKHKCWYNEREINSFGFKTAFLERYDERGDIGVFTFGEGID